MFKFKKYELSKYQVTLIPIRAYGETGRVGKSIEIEAESAIHAVNKARKKINVPNGYTLKARLIG